MNLNALLHPCKLCRLYRRIANLRCILRLDPTNECAKSRLAIHEATLCWFGRAAVWILERVG